MLKLKKRFLLLMLGFLMVVSVGCNTGNEQQDPKPKEEDSKPVVVRLRGGDYGLPQPFACYSRGPGFYKVKLIFDSLIEKDDKGPIPWLAESWDVEDDGKKYVFKLREDVKWSDGKSFTASDVVFTYNYIKEYPAVAANGLTLKKGIINEVKALSDYKVEFDLSTANAGFIEALTTVNIIPKHIWEGVDRPDEFSAPESLVGTGPFSLADYSKENGTYKFEAVKDFWGPAPAVDVIEYVPVSDSVLSLEKGDIHITTIPVDSLSRFQNNPEFTVMSNPGVWGYRLRFNMEKVPEFKSKEFRQAFAYAIDRKDIVDKIARGAGVPGSMGILPTDHIYYNPDIPKYEKNIEKSKDLLSQSEVEIKEYELLLGKGLELRMGELIKEHLEEVGIKVKVVSMDTKSRDAKIVDGSYELIICGHGGWGRDVDYLRTRFGSEIKSWSSGTPGYVNPEFTKLAQKQLIEMDSDKRKGIAMQMQMILAEDVPEIPLLMRAGNTVYRNTIHDGWMYEYNHHESTHNKLSFLKY